MALSLNRIFLFVCCLFASVCFSQNAEDIHRPKDYKNKEEFERFYKRRKAIGNWQVNQLKKGALVVRLKTDKMLVEALLKEGNKTLADIKRLEMAAVNINTMKAYLKSYTFSKVYFIYSSSSDSLLRGARSGIFLDTTLNVDSSITMTENFYLLAERDYAYNSSIGFVPEDSARFEVEKGNPIKEMAVVVKNKYGHQLKKPFPYEAHDKIDLKKTALYVTYVTINGVSYPFNVGNKTLGGKNEVHTTINGEKATLTIPKNLTYEKMWITIDNFNNELNRYYQSSPPVPDDRISTDVKPFLY